MKCHVKLFVRSIGRCLAGLGIGGVFLLPVHAQEFRHVGQYRLVSQAKITRTQSVEMPIQPMVFAVRCDGVQVKLSLIDQSETETTYHIYRADGLVRQPAATAAVELVPGIQATCQAGGVLRHLRLCRDSLTLTTFPDAVEQTLVLHAVAIPSPPPATP